jgi:hypothetical protein
VITHACPRRACNGEALSLIEEFLVWKLMGGARYAELPARTIDAFFALEREWREERRDGDS